MEHLLRNAMWRSNSKQKSPLHCANPFFLPSFVQLYENEIVTCAPLSSYLTYRFIAWKVVFGWIEYRETINDEWMIIYNYSFLEVGTLGQSS